MSNPSIPSSDAAQSVGQDRQYKDMTEKYDAEHGKYNHNIQGETPNLPNAGQAGQDPSPYKIGQ